jgi:biopolymer transport protein TolR
MGGAAPTPTGKGGKKPLDASLNLVPFIDLLSCCISFLLITAVWTQLARMDVQQKGQSSAGASDEKPPENVVVLTLFIDKDGYTLNKMPMNDNTAIPKKGDEYDYVKLADTLKDVKTAYPDKNDIMVKSDDDVIYNNIIKTMDVMLSNKFSDVSLGDKGAAM